MTLPQLDLKNWTKKNTSPLLSCYLATSSQLFTTIYVAVLFLECFTFVVQLLFSLSSFLKSKYILQLCHVPESNFVFMSTFWTGFELSSCVFSPSHGLIYVRFICALCNNSCIFHVLQFTLYLFLPNSSQLPVIYVCYMFCFFNKSPHRLAIASQVNFYFAVFRSIVPYHVGTYLIPKTSPHLSHIMCIPSSFIIHHSSH